VARRAGFGSAWCWVLPHIRRSATQTMNQKLKITAPPRTGTFARVFPLGADFRVQNFEHSMGMN
jgi:hypothetical protein